MEYATRFTDMLKLTTSTCHPGKIISFLTFWDTNNLYEWVMSQKLHVDGFE